MSLIPLQILIAMAVAAVLAAAFQASRHRIVRRLAVRSAFRRPGETVLVVAGSLLGTAIITGSFIVGDTLDSSIRATAFTQLGPVDEVIAADDASRADDIADEVRDLDDGRIDDVARLTAVPAAVAARSQGRDLAEPAAQLLELDFEAGRGFGGDPKATGIEGDTPSPGTAVITEDLAETLSAEPGDRVTVYLFDSELRVEVDRVLPRLGLAGFWLGIESKSPNAFMAPGTIARVAATAPARRAVPPTNYVLVSNRGGVIEGGELSGAVTRLIEESVSGAADLRVDPVKETRLENADEFGDEFSELFLGIGTFAIVAGILLLINIFVMLAEERKPQLGMLRAVGMRRAELVRYFVIEGSMYGSVASVLGAALGIGVGWAIVQVAAPIFSATGDFSLDLVFTVTTDSIVRGLCIGLLISLATVLLTSVRISRINIIAAIRDLPEVRSRHPRTRTVIFGTAAAAGAAAWFFSSLGSGRWQPALLGPAFAAFGVLPILSRVIKRRTAVLAVSGFCLLWGVFGNALTDGQFFDEGDIFAFVAQGVLLTFTAVVFLSQTQENLEKGLRRVAARNLPLRLGLAYPLARRFRTGLTLGMYSLVMFTMVFIAVMATVFGGQVDTTTRKEAGGFDILADANPSNPPTVGQLSAIEGVERVATLIHSTALFEVQGAEPEPWTITGIDRTFVETGPPVLAERAPGYAGADEVWRTILEDPSTAVVSSFFLQGGAGPGATVIEMSDHMTVIDPVTGKSAERTVIGMTDTDFAFGGAFASTASVSEVLGKRAVPNRFYIATEESESTARVIAANLQGEFIENGVEADTFRAIVEEFQSINLQFLRLMQGYLALGLLVGIAGLGVVMVRAVRERRREIGVLRSLGFLADQVRRTFMLESGYVALQGIVIGTVLALITASQLVAHGDFGENVRFIVPWTQIGVLFASSLGASLLATAWPAHQASTIPPAVALRVAE